MRPLAVLDLEVYPNYFLVAFLDCETGRTKMFEHPLDFAGIWAVLNRYRIVTFNGLNYDIPILKYALKGATAEELKIASDQIILENMKPWVFAERYNVSLGDDNMYGDHISHVDLMPVAPGKASLKTYAGRMHSTTIRELPYPPETHLTEAQRVVVREYCATDLRVTQELYNTLKVQLELREEMSAQYQLDLRSKSDAQIAEAVIKLECEKVLKRKIVSPKGAGKTEPYFHFDVPDWMTFRTPVMQETLVLVKATPFNVDFNGKVILPRTLTDLKLQIGAGTYRMGIGGLHSSEKNVATYANKDMCILDRDVTSYYPAILLNQNLYPKHVGAGFVDVYRSLVERRLAAKKRMNEVKKEIIEIDKLLK